MQQLQEDAYRQQLPGTGKLTKHLKKKHLELYHSVIVDSSHTTPRVGEEGEAFEIYSFDDAFPHHVRYVRKLASLHQAPYEGLNKENREWIRGMNKRSVPPSYVTINRCTACQWMPGC